MDESFFDIMERMESLVPEYGYSNMKNIRETDRKIRAYLISVLKTIKDDLFHVVQASYEIEKDKLSEAAEDVWDDVTSLVKRAENSNICSQKDSDDICKKCVSRAEKNLSNLIRRDRELVLMVKDMSKDARMLNKMLFDRGREKYFIKNLDKIKTYSEEIISLLEEREKSITG